MTTTSHTPATDEPVPATAEDIPPHLLDLFGGLGNLPTIHALTWEDIASAITSSVEDEHQAAWWKCDLCALAYLKWGRWATGQMANLLQVSGEQVRRYRVRGLTFGPQHRDYSKPHNVYDTALRHAAKYGMTPHEAVDLALADNLNARDLLEVMRVKAGEKDTPTAWRELLHKGQTWQGVDLNATVVGTYLDTLHQRLVQAVGDALAGNTLEALSIEVRVSAVCRQEDPDPQRSKE